jgi:hypothetical protein
MSDDLQRLRHWQIKDFPEDKRLGVAGAAKAANQTVAAWLEPIIDRALTGTDATVTRRVNQPEAPPDDLIRLVEAACLFADHAGAMPPGLRNAVGRRLRSALEPDRVTNRVNRPKQLPAPVSGVLGPTVEDANQTLQDGSEASLAAE